jgi:hypothetical protein
LQKEGGGKAFSQLFFFMVQNAPELPLRRGASSASATLRPPQPLASRAVLKGKTPVSF